MPTKQNQSHAKDFFLQLLSTTTLFVAIISFINLWFQYINIAWPDQLNSYITGFYDSIRWSTSALVVVFPVFILTMWLIARDIVGDPEKRDLKTRKWLIYLTLFASAITIIIDLISLIYSFLGGDLTMQFFFKILVVLIVAISVFGYYIWDIRRNTKHRTNAPRKLALLASVIVLGSIVAGFFIVGTPAMQRARRFDDQRVNDLAGITNQIADYWTRNQKIPATLNDLTIESPGLTLPKDPESTTAYTYNVKSSDSFELCANFTTASPKSNDPSRGVPQPAYPYGTYSTDWSHQIGQQCFTRTLSKAQTPPIPYPIIK